MDEVDGIPFAQRALTSLHDSPTLDGHAYHVHAARFGVGLFPVCALSEWLELDVCRDGLRRTQRFARGVPTTPVQRWGRETPRPLASRSCRTRRSSGRLASTAPSWCPWPPMSKYGSFAPSAVTNIDGAQVVPSSPLV